MCATPKRPARASSPPAPPTPSLGDLPGTFWRGVTSTQRLGPALDALLSDVGGRLGAARMAIWLHDRRARELTLVASSGRPADTPPPIPVGDPTAPAARGLRLEQPELLEEGGGQVLLAPLRGWRRALGTLVIEGAPAHLTREVRLDTGQQLARQLSVGIENVQLLEEMLRQRRLLEDTFNSLIDLVIVTDRRQHVVQINDAVAVRVGLTRADLFEKTLSDLVGDDLASWAAPATPDEAADRAENGARTRTLEHLGLGGTFAVTVTPLINEDGEPVGTVLVARDITREIRLEHERTALRARLAQSEKLAALGQFVAGIAHEMNNPLQGVLGHLELLIASSAPARPLRPELRRVYHEANRAAKIVRNLLVFAGSQPARRRRMQIDRVLTRVLSSRRASLKLSGVQVVRDQTPNLPPVLGDPHLLQQALLNVVMNAEHAMSDAGAGGTLSVATQASADGTRVVTTIANSGRGIPSDVLPRIFEPFFTTKEVGQGTGLGLAITYGIIQEHHGAIHAASGSHGATFTIDLPAAPDAPATR